MASRITGVREYRAALKFASPHLRDRVLEAIRATTIAVHARGKANIASMTTRRTGELSRLYRRSVSKKTLRGRVGYLSAASRGKVFYARFVHDGTASTGFGKGITARPFHDNAVEAEHEQDTQRMVRARDKMLANLGGRGFNRGNISQAARILRPGRI